MVKLSRKYVVTILILFLATSMAELYTDGEAKGLIFGSIGYLLFVYDKYKITKYDYFFAGSVIIGIIIEFVTIFYENVDVANWFSVYFTALILFIYLKKGMNYE